MIGGLEWCSALDGGRLGRSCFLFGHLAFLVQQQAYGTYLCHSWSTFQERSSCYSYDEDMDEDEDINSSSLELDGETNANGDESIIRKYLRAN